MIYLQLKFKNHDLKPLNTLLTELKIKGASVNRARYRIVQLLEAQSKTLTHDSQTLVSEYASRDVSGNPIIKDNNYQIDPVKQVEFSKASNELMNEPLLITVDDYVPQLKKLYAFINEYDGELEGTSAYAFGVFLDALEDAGIK